MGLKVNILLAYSDSLCIKRCKRQWFFHTRFVFNPSRKPRVAIVGTGPAGIYCGKTLVSLFRQRIEIDFYDKCLTPYGLLRFGIAPDHKELRAAAKEFDTLLYSPKNHVSFFNSVNVIDCQPFQASMCNIPTMESKPNGFSSIALKTLRHAYDSVVLATGTEEARRLNIPYRSLYGIISGDHFMKWCNGFANNEQTDTHFHSYKFPSQPKSHDLWTVERFVQQTTFLHGAVQRIHPSTPQNPHILILGLGNVALDVARLLLKRHALPFLPPHISTLLPRFHAKHVTIMGRKNLLQNRFSPTQLREILSLRHVHFSRNELLECVTKMNRSEKKTYNLLKSIPLRDPKVYDDTCEPSLHFQGECEPVQYGYSSANPCWVSHFYYKNKNSVTCLPVDIVVECLGYASNGKFSNPLHIYETFSYASKKSNETVCPVFRTGWCKTGSTGALPVTIEDAISTAHKVKIFLNKVSNV